ncbi:hypothetical protein ACFL2Q_05310 [Thermodesulfobacteriota bacterium]
MRAAVIAVLVVLCVIYLGGAVNVGSGPIFYHIDSIIGTSAFMKLHRGVFFLLYRGHGSASEGVARTEKDLGNFQAKPAGIDNKDKYRRLDEAAGR